MAVPKATLWEADPHTKIKHAILREYLNGWLPIMASWNGRIVFIDGFAGPGKYSDGAPGSPIIALRALLEHRAFKTPSQDRRFTFLFIEERADRAETLRQEIALLQTELPFPTTLSYEVTCGTFETEVGALLDELDRNGDHLAPTLAFIDPFGFKGLPMSLVARIAKYRKCECLVTFMYESVNRFLDVDDPKIQEHMQALFGSDEARTLAAIADPQERFTRITGLYERRLREAAGFEYVRTFAMINEGNRVEYVLCFGTHSPKGLSVMKAAMWKADPGDGCRFSDRTAGSPFLFEPEPDFGHLERLLRERFREKGFVDIDEVERFVIVDTPFLSTHVRMKTLAPMERAIPPRIEVRREPGKKKCSYPDGTKIRFL